MSPADHKGRRRRMSRLLARAKAPDKAPSWARPAIFVVGTGRCGTTLLTDLIQGDRIHCLKERQVKSRFQRFERRHIFNMLFRRELTEAQFLRLFQRTRREHMAPLPEDHVFCEKIPHGQWALESIRRVFPHARFIEIYRDGRDTVQSMLNVEWYAPDDEVPRWTPRGDLTEWNALPQFEKCCRRLAGTIPYTLVNMLTYGPDEYLHFSYESLLDDLEGTLRRIEEFVGVELYRDRVKIKPSGGKWRGWSAEQLETYHRVLGERGLAVQELLGYPRASVEDLQLVGK